MMGALLLVLNFVAFAVLAYLLIRKIRRELDTKEIIDKIRDEVNGLIVELNQTTDRNIGIVEERIGRLRSLVDEADKKIQLVDRELQKHDVGIDVYQKLRASAEKRRESPAEESQSYTEPHSVGPLVSARTFDAATTDFPKKKSESVDSVNRNERSPGNASLDSAAAASMSDDKVANNTSLKERVLSLARQGFDARIIATRLGTTIGEVELVLSIESGGRE